VTTLLPTLVAALADRYVLERELGAGGMATVYLAEDVRHRRKVAVKVLRPELAASMGPDRFLREIEIAAQLQHPHILPLLDSGDAGGFLFYVMPFVQGESLRDRLVRERELPVHDALRIITEVADALAHAHERGVVHRDIKPENILLSGRHALVADFGVAKAVSEASGRLKLTSVGVALGTPTYMAPEQASADPGLDHRVDIYALGVVAYELLAGRPPFTGHTAQEVLAAHMTRPPEPIRNFRGNVAPAVETIVLRCLEKHPADRWQTTSELVSQLELLATPSGGMTPTTTRPLAARSAGPRRWLANGAAAGAAILITTAIGFALTRPASPLQLGHRTQVTLTAGIEEMPVPSADGKSIAYVAFAPGDTAERLELRRVEGGSAIALGTGMAPLGWSPDGSQLLTVGPRGLQVVPALGGTPRLLVPGPRFGTWSPDGKSVAYASGDSLFVRPTAGGLVRLIAQSPDPNELAWSPDGRWLAFVSGNSAYLADWNVATSSVWLVDAAGGAPIRLTSGDHTNASPAWISSRRLVFVSDRDRGRDIYQLDLRRDGRPAGEPRRLTTGLNVSLIGVSSDRSRLTYSVARIRSNIWRLPLPASGTASARFAQPVTSGEQNIEIFSISNDGRWLLFDSDRAGLQQVFRMPLPAGEIEPVTDDTFPAFAPRASPDGKEVAYHSIGPKGYRRIFVKPWDGGAPVPVSPEVDADALGPVWWPDGSRLTWWSVPNFSGGAPGRMLAAARSEGSWGKPTPLAAGGAAALSIDFSINGKEFVAYDTARGLVVGSTADDRIRTLVPRSGLEEAIGNPIWAEDRRSVLISYRHAGQAQVREIPVSGGSPRELVRFDGPVERSGKGIMVERGGQLYFTLGENESDLWVVELEGVR
jgi:Tol biopolymer transport system component/tRNA A-37 threonylcarbamoyl transferase component Bud32